MNPGVGQPNRLLECPLQAENPREEAEKAKSLLHKADSHLGDLEK
jgi:hypothetical protein